MAADSEQKLLVGDFSVVPPVATQLDLEGDISIPFEFKSQDIRDITNRGSGFSYDWLLPGTEVNNQYFGGMYDINADFSIFNPNIKTQCLYILDDEEIISGYLQLKEVLRNNAGKIMYRVVLFDVVSNFFQQVEGKKVRNIDLSKLDHILSLSNVKNSWDANWDTNHLGVAGASDGDNGGYFYGLMFDDNPVQPRPIEHFQMGIYKKRILDEMVKQAHPDYPTNEYTWSGTLKDDTFFEREILPYVGDAPKVSEAVANSRTAYVGRGSDITVITNNQVQGILPVTSQQIALNDESTPPFDDANNLWDGSEFTAPSTGLYKFDINIGIDIEVDYDVDSSVTGFDTVDRELRHFAFIDFEIRDGSNNLVNPAWFDAFGVHAPYGLAFEPGGNPSPTTPNPGQFSNKLTNHTTGSYTEGLNLNLPNCTYDIPGAEEAGSIFMQAGWTAKMRVRINTEAIRKWGTDANGVVGYNITETRYIIQQGSSFRSQKFQNSYSDGEQLFVADFLDPNLTQVEFLRDLVNRKNVIIYTNPEDENDIVFDYRDDFFLNGPTLDLTEQVEDGELDTIGMIGELQNAEIVLSYKSGSDYFNKDFLNKSKGDIYGQQRIIFGNEFVKSIKKIESPYQPTPFVRTPLVIPPVFNPPFPPTSAQVSSAIVPALKVNEPKTGPRVLYARKGLLTDDVSELQDGTQVKFQIQYKDGSGALQIDEITGYPYCGHYDHPINPTYDINQGVLPFVLASMPTNAGGQWEPTTNTEFNRRWQNTIEQIAKGRLRKLKTDLLPNQMRFIRKNPNANIFIDNTYYYINKVLFEGNQNLTKLAVLELITVEDSLALPIDPVDYGGSYVGIKDPNYGGGAGQNDAPDTRPPINTGNTDGRNNTRLQIEGGGNIVGSDTEGVRINGDKNFVNSGVKNVVLENCNRCLVFGSNVTLKNVDDIFVNRDNVIVDGNTVTYNGRTELLFNKIDGGQNELRNPLAINDINKVDGGEDELVDPFDKNSSIQKIDSDDGIIKEI